MKTNNTEVNYRTYSRNVQLLIDESFAEKVILANDSVRLLDQIVEEVNLVPLERALKRTGRKHRTNPVTMLKIILYAAMEQRYSSRSIEDATCDAGYESEENYTHRHLASDKPLHPVGGGFGVVKWDYGFQRFLHRGNKKVFTEILLVAMGYNVNKYHNKIQQNRTGRQLHEKLTA